ncbi:MAG: 4'-phosphopantetheinyl transferase superfamily protein [Oscillatoriales cyanobacterium]|uniref:4'-phosphopantetheinyl transferase family protein n=1 Tax=unclassified Microcoleus TaxID=2642155 RepID=UPI001DB3AC84|nr:MULTISPECIES: 4'-phosphopantetheinyl transferase superfamily protein [unclassified Microcoleus]TAG08044.1 MAG: 4'-phosphopantetheinyl transferase superfamily protein [Oscillatoriales cyanobacterium]MCC3434017.1 4'-phosphopantetheinyl transferase superfamily protein [Microcoleus sp. PH2017_05_CCC_O_A]MCC3583560.1 4'-phosphopantetheinyl transferase superfamily protein [Microcoleus sp. PH2017_30_WIL_O_A]TAG17491.1 MAG: 4'-phosphopantetheinyl transferase superfamily protein [Oscillatoriales cyan
MTDAKYTIAPLPSWNSPPKDLKLASNEIHVWRVLLTQTASCLQSLEQPLSSDERTKAERFYFQKDRSQFIVSRGALRAILSRYLDIDPSALCFGYNPYGKPFLSAEQGGNELFFNLSHSRGIALIAVTKNRNIGIDIESIRTDFPCQEIAERFFSLLENTVLRSLPLNLQHKAFFTCWTRKEAYIKAVGKGLFIPLDSFDVTLAPGEPAALLNFLENPQEVFRWRLIELISDSDMVATLAVEGDGNKLLCWEWQCSSRT